MFSGVLRKSIQPLCGGAILRVSMTHSPIPISYQRLARLETWARLSLFWFAGRLFVWHGLLAPISRETAQEFHRWLDHIEQLVVRLIYLRAMDMLPDRPHARRRGSPPANPAQRTHIGLVDVRTAMGGRVRNVSGKGSLGHRLMALLRALGSLNLHAVRLARRLARGLTRRRPIRTRWSSIAPHLGVTLAGFAPAIVCACADTS